MRLLVFEFITGGGLANQPLPPSLLQEGYLMRNALIDDLCELAGIDLLILQDARIVASETRDTECIQWFVVGQRKTLKSVFLSLQALYDDVWLIAPETDGILAEWCQFFEQQGKRLCTSAYQEVNTCADKMETFHRLQQAGVHCVPSRELTIPISIDNGDWVLKSNSSAGCDQVYLLRSKQDWIHILAQLDVAARYLTQPYIIGKTLSLSCLFNQGQAYFICCNEQHLSVLNQQFSLEACTINVYTEKAEKYQQLCQAIASAMPKLFGYVGIDFIETESGANLILEINPRLTSSYAAIKAALGINVVAQVLNMLNNNPPILTKLNDQKIYIDMNFGIINAD